MANIIDFIYSNQAYFEDFITRSTVHSNAIEGNTLSYAETYAILFNDNSLIIKNAKPREFFEAINHKYALSYVMEYCKNNEQLTQDLIKRIGIQINKNIDEISGYRTGVVIIKSAEHIPPAPEMIPNLMMQFVHNYNNTVYDNPYQRAATAHIEFERIHPFSDGNGRTGRLLINFEMLKNNLPPVVIDSNQRSEYFNMIATQDINALADFIQDISEKEKERIETFEKLPKQRMNDQLKKAQEKADKQNSTSAPHHLEQEH